MLRTFRLLPKVIAPVAIVSTGLLGLAVTPAAASGAAARGWHTVSIAARGDHVPQGFAGLDAVTCLGSGSCVAGGENNYQQAVIATEVHGSWSRARAVVPPAGYSGPAEITGITCSAATTCTAVGTYDDDNGPHHSFVLTEADGTWLAAQRVTPPVAHVRATVLLSVGCSSAGNCAAAGYAVTHHSTRPLAVSEVNGVWRRAFLPRLPANATSAPAGALPAVSCVRSGTCVAVGQYTSRSGVTPIVASVRRGDWRLRALRGLAGVGLGSVSCPAGRSCVALGEAGPSRVVSITDAHGRWGHEATVPTGVLHGQVVYPILSAMSCVRSSCMAVGFSAGYRFGALAMTYAHGRWGGLKQIATAGSSRFFVASAVSCRAAGRCTAVGHHVGSGDVITLMAASRP